MSMYWIFVIGNVGIFFCVMATVCAFVAGVSAMIYFTNSDYENEESNVGRVCKISTIAFVTSLTIAVFIPSSEQIMQIYVVDNVVEYVKDNDKAKQLPDKVVEVCDKLLDEYLTDKNE